MAKPSLRGRLIEFDRKPIDPYALRGFALDWTDDLTLMQEVNTDRMELNGYSVIRNEDVRRWRLEPKTFIERALKLKGVAPTPLDGVSLASWRNVLETAGRLFPLVTLRREKINPRVCYIGCVRSMTEKVVTLTKIDPDARWGDTKRYRFSDLTKVDFGGGYEDALAMVATDNKRKRK